MKTLLDEQSVAKVAAFRKEIEEANVPAMSYLTMYDGLVADKELQHGLKMLADIPIDPTPYNEDDQAAIRIAKAWLWCLPTPK